MLGNRRCYHAIGQGKDALVDRRSGAPITFPTRPVTFVGWSRILVPPFNRTGRDA